MSTDLKVCFHDSCFDGAASAALFTRFYETCVERPASIRYLGLTHGGGAKGSPFPDGAFDAPVNAVVDFRYSPDPLLTWWFDHHISAFARPEDEAHFRADTSGRRFFDPTARSCTKFMVDTAVARFGFDAAPYSELVHWADIIDGAQFPDAATAVRLEEPALRVMTWLEHNRDPAATQRLILSLCDTPLERLGRADWIAGPLDPILREHEQTIDRVRQAGHDEHGVVEIDLMAGGPVVPNKFIAYYLWPDARYTVLTTAGPERTKISVGSNPWSKHPRTHNIARICERYGGGGHPVVGAVTLPAGQIDRAHEIATEIAAELRRDGEVG
jgi:hypothetical protein